jgi:hypothetical protein
MAGVPTLVYDVAYVTGDALSTDSNAVPVWLVVVVFPVTAAPLRLIVTVSSVHPNDTVTLLDVAAAVVIRRYHVTRYNPADNDEAGIDVVLILAACPETETVCIRTGASFTVVVRFRSQTCHVRRIKPVFGSVMASRAGIGGFAISAAHSTHRQTHPRCATEWGR